MSSVETQQRSIRMPNPPFLKLTTARLRQLRIKTGFGWRQSVVHVGRVTLQPAWICLPPIYPCQRPETGPPRNLRAAWILYKAEKCWSHPPQTDTRWADLSLEPRGSEITESLPYGKHEKASARPGLCQEVFQCGYSQAGFSSNGVQSRCFRELMVDVLAKSIREGLVANPKRNKKSKSPWF